jgi:hypothetical protein
MASGAQAHRSRTGLGGMMLALSLAGISSCTGRGSTTGSEGVAQVSQGLSDDGGDATAGEGGSCSCSGTGASGPVTVSCGQTTCGTDDNTYVCRPALVVVAGGRSRRGTKTQHLNSHSPRPQQGPYTRSST